MSSFAINDYISSKEKKVFKHLGGHVSLCISNEAHKELWPKVVNWIKSTKLIPYSYSSSICDLLMYSSKIVV